MNFDELIDQLEAVLDATSLDAILRALSAICARKAEHLEDSRKDDELAKDWRRSSALLFHFLLSELQPKSSAKEPTT